MGRLVCPQAIEVRLFAGHPLGLRSFTPALEDADALPVLAPARRGLVEAAGPGDPVADPVFDHPRLLVEDAVCGDGPSVGVAGHGDLHFEVAARNHPGEQFQGVGRLLVRGFERDGAQVLLHGFSKALASVDRVDLGLVQSAAHEQSHAASIADQPFDPTRRQGQRAGLEVPGQPVVAFRVLERREIEDSHQVAVLRRVLQAPVVVREHRVM